MDGLIIVWVSAVAATAPLRHVTMAVAAAAAIFMGDGTEFWEWGAAEGGRRCLLLLRLGRYRRLLRISSIGFRRSLDDESGKKIISGVSRFNLSSHCTMGNFCLVLKTKTYEFDATADESAKKMISGPLSTDFKDVTFLHEMKTCSNSYASE